MGSLASRTVPNPCSAGSARRPTSTNLGAAGGPVPSRKRVGGTKTRQAQPKWLTGRMETWHLRKPSNETPLNSSIGSSPWLMTAAWLQTDRPGRHLSVGWRAPCSPCAHSSTRGRPLIPTTRAPLKATSSAAILLRFLSSMLGAW